MAWRTWVRISFAAKANPESFCKLQSRRGATQCRATKQSAGSVDDHKRMTEGVECRKDSDVIDETPAAYKPIEAVMAAQADLVEIAHTLRQVVCVKG